MKKKLCAVLAALTLLACVPASAANADVTVTLGSTRCGAGETVLVPLSLESAVNINSIGVTGFTYDTDALTFNGFVDPGDLVTAAALPSLDNENATVVLGYMTPAKLSGGICALSFAVADDAQPGDYTITFTPVIKNSATVISSVEAVAGTVTVEGQQTPPEEAYTLGMSLMSGNGTAISSIPDGPFWASVSISKNAEADCGILVATYTADHQFLDLFQANVRQLSVGQSFLLDFYIPNPDGRVAQVKAFALSSLAQLAPLGPAVSMEK